MHILLTSHYLAKTGGTESYTFALAMELLRRGHHVEHFAIERGGVSDILAEHGVPFMSSDHYDLILANHTTTTEAVHTRGFTIQTCHGPTAMLEQPSPWANIHVAVSEEVRDHLLHLGYPVAAVIHNGINCLRFRPRRPIATELRTVLSLCQSDTANAFVRRCCERDGLRFLQANKYTDNVWAIEELINQSDLVVGLGRSAYDAMACGRPVIVYDYREYMGEFLGDGILTPDNIHDSLRCNCSGRSHRLKYDEQAFIAEMHKYTPDLGTWSRQFAVRNLNIRHTVGEYMKVFKR